jgi:hypothetical protein
VHQRLGKGSTRIVSAYIRQWREAQALSKALERDPLFGEWPEALQLKARSLFDGLLALSAEAANASAESQGEFRGAGGVLAAEAQEAPAWQMTPSASCAPSKPKAHVSRRRSGLSRQRRKAGRT